MDLSIKTRQSAAALLIVVGFAALAGGTDVGRAAVTDGASAVAHFFNIGASAHVGGTVHQNDENAPPPR